MQSRDRLHGMRPADGPRAGFGQAEVPHLAVLDQVFDGARHILDRHVRIDAMLIEQIDAISAEAFQRGVGDLLDMLRPAVDAELRHFAAELVAELGRDHDPVAERGQRLADDFLVLVGTVCLGGIEEGDAALHGRADQADRVRPGCWRLIIGRQAHAAQSNRRNLEA